MNGVAVLLCQELGLGDVDNEADDGDHNGIGKQLTQEATVRNGHTKTVCVYV